MPLTKRATRLICVVVLLGFGIVGFSAQGQVLDLRKAAAGGKNSPGIPGSSVGNIAGARDLARPYQLPLRLQIDKLSVHENGTTISVELRLVNLSTSQLSIPSCVDGRKAHEPKAVGRRTFQFGLTVQSSKQQVDELMDVTFASFSFPECSIVLDPGKSLQVIDDLRVPKEALATEGKISVKAFVSESKIEDGRYYIQASSQRVESNSVDIPRP